MWAGAELNKYSSNKNTPFLTFTALILAQLFSFVLQILIKNHMSIMCSVCIEQQIIWSLSVEWLQK